MNEKQRWLLKDLDTWREQQYARIGRYGPHKPTTKPPSVRAAERAQKAAAAVIREWDRTKNAPWQKQHDAINAQAQAVKRIILFEKTEAALKAIRSLK